jgi:hypothetical protein
MGVSEHGALLHGGVSGAAREHVVLATKPAGEGWHERIYAAGELAEVLLLLRRKERRVRLDPAVLGLASDRTPRRLRGARGGR